MDLKFLDVTISASTIMVDVPLPFAFQNINFVIFWVVVSNIPYFQPYLGK